MDKLTGQRQPMCKICKKNYGKKYNEQNKEKQKEYNKNYRANPEKFKRIQECKRKWRANPENAAKHLAYQNERTKQRRASDPAYRMRVNVTSHIYKSIRRKGYSKNASFLEYVDWTPEELKRHLENLWESWMTWDNYGVAVVGQKRWNIDHIIPQSKLPYDSLQHSNFKICWSLSNLRPMEAIANIRKKNK